jgi:hypothetical protein
MNLRAEAILSRPEAETAVAKKKKKKKREERKEEEDLERKMKMEFEFEFALQGLWLPSRTHLCPKWGWSLSKLKPRVVLEQRECWLRDCFDVCVAPKAEGKINKS